MKWQPGDDRYVEDRRGMSIGGRGVPMGIGGVLVLLVLSWLTGTDLLSLLGPATEQGGGQTVQRPVDPAQEPLAKMAGALLTDLNETWARTLGDRYQPTTVVLFTDRVNAEGCGIAGSATGPFYCPATRKVYIDLGFYRELEERFGAPGDFAQAYVLAHEVGHHVQALLGIESRVRGAQGVGPAAGQRAVGADGAAGRLLCRRVGTRRVPGRWPRRARGWRCGRGPPGGGRHRR